MYNDTIKILKFQTPEKFAAITLNFEQCGFITYRVMHPKDADGIANSVDPDQTAPLGAVWSGSALFAQSCLSDNLGSLRYTRCNVSFYDIKSWLILEENIVQISSKVGQTNSHETS